MNREHKLYLWAALFLVVASCFIESGSYLIVAVLALVGLAFALWGYRVEVRHGQR